MAAPDLYVDKVTKKPLPIETIGASQTAYLDIDLKITDRSVQHMTAVFAPDPTVLSGPVDVILWLHGDKSYWNKDRTDKRTFHNEPIQHYLNNFPLCDLRSFILQQEKKKFVLVAPTITNSAQAVRFDTASSGALGWKQAAAENYLQQCLDGVEKHMGAKGLGGVGNIILAAHSGGGHLQINMADKFSGMFDTMNEIWCFDSTYFGYEGLVKWLRKGHSDTKLWIYSTGGTTGKWASNILKLNPPTPAYKPKPVSAKAGAVGKMVGAVRQEVRDAIHEMGWLAHGLTVALQTTKIEVWIDGKKPTDFFLHDYGGSPSAHYESIPQYLTTLVERSRNLE